MDTLAAPIPTTAKITLHDIADIAALLGLHRDTVASRLAALGLVASARSDLAQVATLVVEASGEFLDRLYATLAGFPETGALLSNQAQVRRLKLEQQRYLAEMFGAPIDWEYVLRRLRTGVVHHRVGLSPRWYVSTYARFVCGHVEFLLTTAPSRDVGVERVLTLLRTAFFDASLALDAYGHQADAAIWLRAHGGDAPADGSEHVPASGAPPHERNAPTLSRIRLSADESAERRRFIGLTDEDVALLQTQHENVLGLIPAVLDDFYELLRSSPDTAELVPDATVAQLKRQVATYWRELTRGEFDRPYAASRMRIGVIHESIGLTPAAYLTGMARQVVGFLRVLALEQADPAPLISAFVRAAFFDVSFVLDAYLEARAARLLRTEAYASQLVSGLASAVAVIDSRDRLVSANRTLISMLGGDASVLYMMPLASALPIAAAGRLVDKLRRGEAERASGLGTFGSRSLHMTAMRLAGESQDAEPRIAVVLDDVTDLMRVADDFRSQSTHLDLGLDAVDLVSWDLDLSSWTILSISRASLAVTGYRDVHFLGRPRAWIDAMEPEFRADLVARIERARPGERFEVDYRFVRADGRKVWLRSLARREKVGDVDRVFAATLDVTAERMAAELRLEAVGRLAGGVAHTMNNALTALFGALELHAESIGGVKAHPWLQRAGEAGQRVKDVTARLLAFAARQPLRPTPVAPMDVIAGMRDEFEVMLGDSVRVIIEEHEASWRTKIDTTGFAKALGCLASNARAALPAGGTFRVTAHEVRSDELQVSDPDYGKDWIDVTVVDDGVGMSHETLSRAFEPFFTTGTSTRSDGLGLSLVHGFMLQSGGRVWIESAPGAGTKVHLRFPRWTPVQRSLGAAQDWLASTNVLVVDDDPSVLEVTSQLARRHGSKVLEASSAADALAMAKSHSIDVVIADILLNDGVDGVELARTLLRARPNLVVILMSGYSPTHFDLSTLPANVTFLRKPFTTKELDRALECAAKAAQ